MAGDLKAVVEITADTSGLVKGIDGAMKKIEGATGMTAAFTGFDAAMKVINFAEKLWNGLNARMDELDNMAKTWSAVAMSADMERTMSKIRDEQRIGEAIGPYTAASEADKMKQEQASSEATVARADNIGKGKMAWQQVANMFTGMGSSLYDNFLNFSGRVYDNPAKAIGDTALSNLGAGFYNQDNEGNYRWSTEPVVDALNEIKMLLKGK